MQLKKNINICVKLIFMLICIISGVALCSMGRVNTECKCDTPTPITVVEAPVNPINLIVKE